ncbi:hypothetical protein BK125_16745 [Paenibacillus odorifer]|jgi:hypothetical protein|uniref:Uncharacterized protein n=1 Tax=Paenibacillus odorifer TaxID=189426 RepID=A0ABX3GGH3_9BACL|nr:hypothetical protein BK125_16745 [Paenibacillus odorifer]OMD18975.1 hypothetical protein BSO21_26020 [Paenibacillus odorifer]
MKNEKKENQNIYKWFSIISITLIPLAAGIGIVFDINRDPIQLLIMTLGFLSISWINWSKYKEKSKL